MTKMWKAVLNVQVPVGLRKSDGTQNTSSRTITVVVPDAGGFYNTKVLLEGTYGAGTVVGLMTHDSRYA